MSRVFLQHSDTLRHFAIIGLHKIYWNSCSNYKRKYVCQELEILSLVFFYWVTENRSKSKSSRKSEGQ